MKKISFPFILLFFVATLIAQNFEGKITYDIQFKSKNFMISDAKLTEMMGNIQEYYFKDGNYKTILNGSMMQWQMYISKDLKLYTKAAGSETIFWNDATENKDEVLSFQYNKNAANILGYNCDELILNCKSGVQKYYFSKEFPLDAALFKKHAFGNWYEYMKHAGAVPLKIEMDTKQFSMVQQATSVKEQKLNARLFELPADAKTAPSPF
jgi:hypothetical protein